MLFSGFSSPLIQMCHYDNLAELKQLHASVAKSIKTVFGHIFDRVSWIPCIFAFRPSSLEPREPEPDPSTTDISSMDVNLAW